MEHNQVPGVSSQGEEAGLCLDQEGGARLRLAALDNIQPIESYNLLGVVQWGEDERLTKDLYVVCVVDIYWVLQCLIFVFRWISTGLLMCFTGNSSVVSVCPCFTWISALSCSCGNCRSSILLFLVNVSCGISWMSFVILPFSDEGIEWTPCGCAVW